MAKERDRHARIYCRIWDDDDWKAMSPRGQWFYMLLTSQANLNWAGVIDLTTKRWRQLASGPSVEQQVAMAMDELEAANFIVVDRDTEELLVRSLMRAGKVAQQPNVLKAALRQAQEVHSRPIRSALVLELRRLNHPDAEATADALAKGFGNPSGNPSPDPSGKGSSNPGEWERESSSSHLGKSVRSTTSSSEIASRPSDPPRSDVEGLCSRLLERIHSNGSRGSITKRWRTEARLLLDRDKRPLDEAQRLIDWATADSFWKSNILSMPTFRSKYDQLRLQAGRHAEPGLRLVSNGYRPFQNPTDPNAYDEELI